MSRPAGLGGGEAARKALHIGAGLLALLLPWLTRWQGAGLCLIAFLLNWQVLPRVTRRALERDQERRRGYAPGILIYPLAVGALFVLFGARLPVVAAAWGILAFGDGSATLAGRGVGGPPLAWNPDKTVSGLLAFAGAGGAAASLLYLWVEMWQRQAGRLTAQHLAGVALACAAAAVLGALIESLPGGLDDNLTVPLMTGGFLYALAQVRPEQIQERSAWLLSNLAAGCLVNLIVAGLAWRARAVRPSGAVAGFLIGVGIYTFGGWRAFAVLVLFFALGTTATRVGYARKEALRIAQEAGGRRGARHAVANCGLPAFLAFLAVSTPHGDLLTLALVASLATAAFDTVSSEIGQVYGRRPYLITTLRRVPAGTEGAVSLEGTMAGLAAAGLVAAAALLLGMIDALGWAGAGVAVAAAFIGTTAESLLGATAGSARLMDSEAMNFANTLVGALCALGLGSLVLS